MGRATTLCTFIFEIFRTKVGLKLFLRIPSIYSKFCQFLLIIIVIYIGIVTTEIFKIIYLYFVVFFIYGDFTSYRFVS
jgi:hypothetical protein